MSQWHYYSNFASLSSVGWPNIPPSKFLHCMSCSSIYCPEFQNTWRGHFTIAVVSVPPRRMLPCLDFTLLVPQSCKSFKMTVTNIMLLVFSTGNSVDTADWLLETAINMVVRQLHWTPHSSFCLRTGQIPTNSSYAWSKKFNYLTSPLALGHLCMCLSWIFLLNGEEFSLGIFENHTLLSL